MGSGKRDHIMTMLQRWLREADPVASESPPTGADLERMLQRTITTADEHCDRSRMSSRVLWGTAAVAGLGHAIFVRKAARDEVADVQIGLDHENEWAIRWGVHTAILPSDER